MRENGVSSGEGYAVANLADLGEGPGFRKIRGALGVTAFGVNAIVLKDEAEENLLDALRKVESGQRSVPERLLQRALDLSLTGGNADPLSSLAPRERQIAAHVGRGLRNKEIADALAMSEGTVKVYLHTIYQKLGIKNRTELALIAHKAGEAGPNFS